MNFLDTYDIAGQNAPPRQPEQSLNEEVTEVIGQLGRFWGGFKKQSQSVFETARKDLTNVVSQAQKEITKLTSEPATESTPSTSSTQTTDPDPTTQVSEQEDGIRSPEDTPVSSTSTTTSLFSRFQSALPPNLLQTAREQIPESLKHATDNIDFPQLRNSFVNEFQRVQEITRTQAGEYAHKSEALFREAVKEAGDVLRDAVKILPPEEIGGGLVWDGTDMWSLPLEPSETAPTGKPQRRAEAQEAVATRAESLFKRLRNDPVILKRDPALDSGELFTTWIAEEVTTQEGGISGKYWTEKVDAILGDTGIGETMKTTRDTLVPSELSEGDFWTRYFFRAHQIETEEQKRKALLEGTLEEEDFSWEDDDEEGSSDLPSSASTGNLAAEVPPIANETKVADKDLLSATSSSVAQDSSEDYDVVSSGNVSPKEEHKPLQVQPDESKDSSDGDSDWE